VYDPNTDSWTDTGALAVGRHAHTVADLTDGRVVVTGGVRATAPATPGPDDSALTASSEVFTP
jgi:hypothetical protein